MSKKEFRICRINVNCFNLDLDPHGTTELLADGAVSFEEPSPPLRPNPKPPSPPRQKPLYPARVAPWQRGQGSRWRGGLGRGQMFEDPAVIRIVEGRPSLMVTKMAALRSDWFVF